MTKTKEVKAMIIQNFIDHIAFQLDDDTLNVVRGISDTYVAEDHVDEIGQAFPSTVMTERDLCVERLSRYISDDANEAYGKLVEQEEIGSGGVMADDVVLMWEPLEGRYTVSELLYEIS